MRIVAITGGAQGIGRATAYHFATAGYGVSICDPDDDAGREALDCFRSLGAKGVFAAIDVAREDDVRGWIARTGHELGCPDVLINNAGISRNKPFLDLTAEDFDTVIGVNLRGTFLCSQAVARRMVARGRGGAIINIASTRAFMSEAGTEAYTASKGGTISLTHGMAISLGPHGIRVNAISPGWIETRDWQYSSRAKAPVHSERDRLQHPVDCRTSTRSVMRRSSLMDDGTTSDKRASRAKATNSPQLIAFEAVLPHRQRESFARVRSGRSARHHVQRAGLPRRVDVLWRAHNHRPRRHDCSADRGVRRRRLRAQCRQCYFIPIGLFIKAGAPESFWTSIGKTAADFPGLTWSNFLVGNLLPVTIGNIIGGSIMVAAVYWFVYLRTRTS